MTSKLGTSTLHYILAIGGAGFSPADKSTYQGGNQICKNGMPASLNSTKRILELLWTRSLLGATFWIGSVDQKKIINGIFYNQVEFILSQC